MKRAPIVALSAIQRAFRLCGGPQAVMALLGIGLSTYYAYLAGTRGKDGLPPEHCSNLEAHLNGAVTRRELRPNDWWLIWPELVTAEFQIPERKAA
jgi:DNA-binding transcriptional regulator YdaS (Cro superfamily)